LQIDLSQCADNYVIQPVNRSQGVIERAKNLLLQGGDDHDLAALPRDAFEDKDRIKCVDIRTDGEYFYFDLQPFDARRAGVACCI